MDTCDLDPSTSNTDHVGALFTKCEFGWCMVWLIEEFHCNSHAM